MMVLNFSLLFSVNIKDAKKLIRIGSRLQRDPHFPNFPKSSLVTSDNKPYFDSEFNFRGRDKDLLPHKSVKAKHRINEKKTKLLKQALGWSASPNLGQSYLKPDEKQLYISPQKASDANSLFLQLTDQDGKIRPEYDLSKNGVLSTKDLELLAALSGDPNTISRADLEIARNLYFSDTVPPVQDGS